MDVVETEIPTFQHEPIWLGYPIRLLILEASRDSDSVIQCSLFSTFLNESTGKYEALSYVWGSTRTNDIIFCNCKPLYVNRNCYLALKYLRKKRRRRYLWIDNICIDQSCWTERGCQVELMESIYENARKLIIWLGEEEPGTRRAFRRRRNSCLLENVSEVFHVPKVVQKAVEITCRYPTAGARTKEALHATVANGEQMTETNAWCFAGS